MEGKMNREKLIDAGIDYDQGVNRFAGKQDIYEKFLKKLFEKQLMEDLKIKLKEKNYEEAFRIAHDLKGTSGNLSVTLFYKKICEIVENLREERNEESLLNLFNQAEMLYLNAKKAVGDE